VHGHGARGAHRQDAGELPKKPGRCWRGLEHTSRAIEDEFVDVVAEDPQYSRKKLFAIGPRCSTRPHTDRTPMDSRGTSAWIGWTSNHRRRVCTSTGQVTELATALCDSKQQFLWVLSDVDRAG
jgi:hypothetical protein